MDSSQKPSPKLKYYNISLVQCKTKRQKYEFIKLLSTACHALLLSTVHYCMPLSLTYLLVFITVVLFLNGNLYGFKYPSTLSGRCSNVSHLTKCHLH